MSADMAVEQAEACNQALQWMTTITTMDSSLNLRTKIAMFERDFIEACEGQKDLKVPFLDVIESSPPLIHSFADGVYIREITLPAGAIIIGAIHRHKHLNFISRGHVRCVTEAGGVEDLVGPCTMVSPAGTKRVLYVYEETVWTTVHRTEFDTVKEAEAEAIAETYSAMGLSDPIIPERELEG